LAGDLDNIVRKAIEKHPARRYAHGGGIRQEIWIAIWPGVRCRRAGFPVVSRAEIRGAQPAAGGRRRAA
jgi:hypothetical protein